MGGCIAGRTYAAYAERVSSLYGRVYRSEDMLTPIGGSFLPVWEGVSALSQVRAQVQQFPPCMGGCIEKIIGRQCSPRVSSLYGRVFQEVFSMSWKDKAIIFLIIFFTLFLTTWFSRSYKVPNEGDPCVVGIEQQT